MENACSMLEIAVMLLNAIENLERIEDSTFILCKRENWKFEYFADTWNIGS